MSEVNVNGERKRRLPLWMSGVTAPDQVEKSGSKDEVISSTRLNSLSKALKPKVTRVAKRVAKEIVGNDALEVDSSLLVKDETRKRVKKSRRQELDHDDPFNSEDDLPKKRMKKGVDVIKRKAKDITLPKKRNQKSIGLGSGEETRDPLTSEDDEELTVEDLVSIAEEYVEADKKKGHRKQAITEHESAHLPEVSDFSRNETVGSIGDAQSSRNLPADITMGPSSTNDMIRSQNQVSSASNGSNPSQTGEPAQDMLDLFLGPLLKKPQTEERKPAFITQDIALALESEFRKHSGDGILGEKVVTLTKKKSSLKDKVAMFFD